jgi:hypothetical protein
MESLITLSSWNFAMPYLRPIYLDTSNVVRTCRPPNMPPKLECAMGRPETTGGADNEVVEAHR